MLLTFRVRLYRNILAIYTRLNIYYIYIIFSSAVEIVNNYFLTLLKTILGCIDDSLYSKTHYYLCRFAQNVEFRIKFERERLAHL